MSLGHYLWTNTSPGPGYGQQFDIDVDSLPVTDEPSNVLKPNVYFDQDTGEFFHCWPVPNFYFDPVDGRLMHSTTPPTAEFMAGIERPTKLTTPLPKGDAA